MTYPIKADESSDELKNIFDSILSGAKSPEETLENLDKFGIDWYVTEEGDLMIRYWQIGAEDFMPPESAAIIRSTGSAPGQSDELDWLSKNLQNIRAQYGGQWVAIHGNEILAASANLPDLMDQIPGVDRPLITQIPADPVVWTSTYAC